MNLLKKLKTSMCAAMVFSLLSTILFCIQVKKNNPLLPGYQGDYSLTILSSGLPDSLMVFHRYAVACSTGADTFSTFQLAIADTGVMRIDSIRFSNRRVDSIFFHCNKTYNNKVFISGVRPNELIVEDSIHLRVFNPYFIQGDSSAVANETTICTIGRPSPDTTSSGLRVIWSEGGIKQTIRIDASFLFVPTTSQPRCTVSAVIQDSTGHTDTLASFFINVNTGIRPVLSSAALSAAPTLGKPLTLAIALAGTDTTSFHVYVTHGTWNDSAVVSPFKAQDTISLSNPINDLGPDTFFVYTINAAKLQSNVIKIPATISYALPVISFTAESLLVSLGDTFPVTVSSAPAAAKYVWRVDLLKADTTATPNYSVLINDSLYHTLMVYGVDSYGFAGKTSSIIVYARPFQYVIQPAAFPLDVKARSWTQWIAGVNNTTRATQKKAKYTWSVSPQNYDSSKFSGAANDTMWLYFKDSAHTIVTLTIADTANGSCAPYSKSVSVRRYAPSLTFKSHAVTAKTTDNIALAVSVADSNPTGYVDSIFWHRAGKNPASYASASKDSFWTIQSNAPDTFWVSAYCRDNAGFLSSKDSAQVFVKAFQPYFQPLMNDTTVFINSPVTFTAFGHVSDSTATIVKYLWDFDGNGTWDDSAMTSQDTHTFPVAGTTKVIVKCRDSKGLESVPDTFRVTVSRGGPVVSGLTPDTCWVKDSVVYTVNAREINPNGAIVSYGISWDGGTDFTPYTTSSSMKNAFAASGMKYVRMYALDNNGISSDTVTDSVFVKADVPVVDSIRADSTIFILDTRTFTVSAHDPHTTIDSFKVFWVSSSSVSATGTFTHSFLTTESGTQTIKAIVKNHDGFWSDTLRQAFMVNIATPAVSSISVSDTAANLVFVNDARKYQIVASSPHGLITKVYVNWHGTTAYEDSIVRTGSTVADTISHTYGVTESGLRTVQAWALDDEGITSAALAKQITVRLGKPVITGIASDTNASSIFINDPITFTISYFDTNGTVDSISVDNGTGVFGTFKMASFGTYALKRTFARSDAGNKIIRAVIKDNDGLISDTAKLTDTVRLGTPVVDSLHIPTTIWINDTNTYQVFAHDTNGTIVKYYFDWTNSGVWQDSSTTASVSGHFNTSGVKTIRFGILDNDTLLTTSTKQVTVHLGMPLISNPGGDTMFVVCPANGGSIKLGISSYDSNGTIQQYYWNFFGPPWDTNVTAQYKTVTDSLTQTILAPSVNFAQEIAVFGKDDDGLVAGDTFWLYPDAPPPVPTFFTYAQSGDSVILKWTAVQDVHDGLKTQVQIYIAQGTTAAPNTPLFSGSLPTLGDSRFGSENVGGIQCYTYKFKCSFSGAGRWSVMLQDARGSQTLGNPSISSFVAP